MTGSRQKHQYAVLVVLVHKALQHRPHSKPVAHDLLLPRRHVRQVVEDPFPLVVGHLSGLRERLCTRPLEGEYAGVLVNHLLKDLGTAKAPELRLGEQFGLVEEVFEDGASGYWKHGGDLVVG